MSWLDSEQASKHLGFKTVGAFRSWKSRHNRGASRPLKAYRIGRNLRFKITDLDRLVECERITSSSAGDPAAV